MAQDRPDKGPERAEEWVAPAVAVEVAVAPDEGWVAVWVAVAAWGAAGDAWAALLPVDRRACVSVRSVATHSRTRAACRAMPSSAPSAAPR